MIAPIFQSIQVTFLLIIVLFLSSCIKDEPPKTKFTLPSNIIHKIVIDKNGTKWIATEKGLVCFRVDRNPYPDIPFDNATSIADLNIASTTGSEIWLTGNTGVSFLKFNEGEILSSGIYSSRENDLFSDGVSAVAIDEMNTRYFGTSMGLSIFKNDQWKVFTGRRTEEILREFKISSIATAKNGWIYAATLGGGVSRFKYTDAVSGATTYDSVWSQLKSNYINTVVIVDDTCQWYGTNLGASYHTSHFTKTIEDWTSYTKDEGLISDTILSIAKDLNGNVWFGTNNGVSRYDGNSFTGFTSEDGLTDNKVNTISVDIDGSVWFGTDNGISHFKNDKWYNYVTK